jgi:hypothetical protein
LVKALIICSFPATGNYVILLNNVSGKKVGPETKYCIHVSRYQHDVHGIRDVHQLNQLIHANDQHLPGEHAGEIPIQTAHVICQHQPWINSYQQTQGRLPDGNRPKHHTSTLLQLYQSVFVPAHIVLHPPGIQPLRHDLLQPVHQVTAENLQSSGHA